MADLASSHSKLRLSEETLAASKSSLEAQLQQADQRIKDLGSQNELLHDQLDRFLKPILPPEQEGDVAPKPIAEALLSETNLKDRTIEGTSKCKFTSTIPPLS